MTRIGNHTLVKTGPAEFVLSGPTGKTVGTYTTARAANTEALARITAALKK